MERWIKPAFAVMGKEGHTREGSDMVQRLWSKANSSFAEVSALAKTQPDGTLCGVWGAMTDEERTFQPWTQDFTCGLYLAGVECRNDAQPPAGWTRWNVPGFEYLRVENNGPDTFLQTLQQMAQAGLQLAGAVQDYTDPATGRGYMCFPVRRLADGED